MTVQFSGRYRVRLSRADIAWLVLGAGVVGYDVTAAPGHTLSEACDAYLLRRPWLTRAIVLAVACHLINAIPSRVDPLHLAFEAHRAWRLRRPGGLPPV